MQVISVNNNYSSGLRRLAAFIIDRMLISIAISIIAGLFGWPFDWSYDWYFNSADGMPWWHIHHLHLVNNSMRELIFIIYYALMESSKYQGTLGKIAMGIRVVDKDGQRIDLPKALLRNLSKILSALIFGIGYIMIIFDERKQGLHDKIADTFVVRQ